MWDAAQKRKERAAMLEAGRSVSPSNARVAPAKEWHPSASYADALESPRKFTVLGANIVVPGNPVADLAFFHTVATCFKFQCGADILVESSVVRH